MRKILNAAADRIVADDLFAAAIVADDATYLAVLASAELALAASDASIAALTRAERARLLSILGDCVVL